MKFNASYLIQKHSQPFKIINSEGGRWNDESGEWESGEESPIDGSGVILPLSSEDLKFGDGGTYTADDRKIFTSNKLTIGQFVEIKEKRYRVASAKDYEDYAGIFIYFVKRVGESSSV